jgi:hypothetical protein
MICVAQKPREAVEAACLGIRAFWQTLWEMTNMSSNQIAAQAPTPSSSSQGETIDPPRGANLPSHTVDQKVWSFDKPIVIGPVRGDTPVDRYTLLDDPYKGPAVQIFRDEANQLFCNVAFRSYPNFRYNAFVDFAFSNSESAPALFTMRYFYSSDQEGCPNQFINTDPKAIGHCEPQVFSALTTASIIVSGGSELRDCRSKRENRPRARSPRAAAGTSGSCVPTRGD